MGEAITQMSGPTGRQIIGADWDATVEQVEGWLQSDWTGWQIVAPEGDTCFTTEGKCSRIDFFAVNRLAKDMMLQVDTGLAEAHHTPTRTHRVVTLTITIMGACG